VSLERLDALPWTEITDLIEQSYAMVAAAKARIARPRKVNSKATKRLRPGTRRAGSKNLDS
jgi:hypothetical protein